MSANRSILFFPLDHLGDVQLRMCSLEAKGLWVDMMCLMSQGEPYGYLRKPSSAKVGKTSKVSEVSVKPPPGQVMSTAPSHGSRHGDRHGELTVPKTGSLEGSLAELLSKPQGVVKRALRELERKGIFSRTPSGIIYSRRMARDAKRFDPIKSRVSTQSRTPSGQFIKKEPESQNGAGVSVKPTPPQVKSTVPSHGTVPPHGAAARSLPSQSLPDHLLTPPPTPAPRGRGYDPVAIARAADRRRRRA